ncbi:MULTISPECIES: hypothetical protein [unclassified Streptomyces]|uniref:hypothetical protein n=1 Tax=unclassified Streptomyces TaxID=2593676 RepID=UPI00278C7B6C|nr:MULTISPECIES: hypothetical protein [unclassified Streptomyces]
MPAAPPSSRLRLYGLIAVVVLTAALPLAGASAGPVDDERPTRPAAAGAGPTEAPGTEAEADTADRASDERDDKPSQAGDERDGKPSQTGDERDGKTSRQESGKPSLLTGLGLTTEAHCGPQLAAPEGIEAQTCVLIHGRDTWARTYYRNATGSVLNAVLTLMAPGGRTVQLHCAVGAEDEPGMCETPRERTRGKPGEYAAVAEYAKGGEGPLLLRSGSNSAPSHGG